ncbi:hypothetical protein TRIATDRAFT_261911 [Trichoderma atroviride IMI 206040]|uniref:MULE transposase domain-containing protein n=1 Tax=Hypocrea atroviridis (strain ATCC 20476 / IMI 206040) TaxID=452589 RepID=G9NJH4_HYPAI|nr:uncharacterized protein TRIATDRAFT_261911 [Trichoderma atroviride IMI 206040]EHK49048.1 hypothetical protein TRIATDRAFT_261911 [Trichoderma atroviride IMI 206040]
MQDGLTYGVMTFLFDSPHQGSYHVVWYTVRDECHQRDVAIYVLKRVFVTLV